ncbi:hypothetical protein BCR39DRAFT_258354 [Naematelia encephala]|uniref:Selenoprotein O n=1 Tax=Naematelia encephala TaxID=71784 RepID=A0A1Y2AVQ5_9TREE|nr:hypothetical protein BCR39DRAFT_258354 [Naematelia encephala]
MRPTSRVLKMAKVPFSRLPIPSTTLQTALPQLPLDEKPSAQRRSTTFATDSAGVWARVNPLWTSWPLRITKEEIEEMGVEVDDEGQGQVSVEDVLRRWDPVDTAGEGVKSSKHRLKLEPELLGVSAATLGDCLPHLDVGDALDLCNGTSSQDSDARSEFIDLLSGRKVRTSEEYGPWSTRYHGHQFGVWAGQLGDGRAMSIFETESEAGGRQEIQLKGAGRTPFSRSADGLAVLRSGVREFLGCEAVAALGIPTTRSLALLTAPIESIPVLREDGPEPPSLLARVAPSFIRIGHFQSLNPGPEGSARQLFFGGGSWLKDDAGSGEAGNLESLGALERWCRQEIMHVEGGTKAWFEEVVKRNAEMVAQWQVYGWMHGVLNTDNISIMGLTIDYGPYAFMDVFDESHICNHSDPTGLYSYRAQPSRVLWALDKLVNTLLPLIGYESIHSRPASAGWSDGISKDDIASWSKQGTEVIAGWEERYWVIERERERSGWLSRFGLKTYRDSDDREIIKAYLGLLKEHCIDFHASFRHLSSFSQSESDDFIAGFIDACTTTGLKDESRESAITAFKPWFAQYASRVFSKDEKHAWESTELSIDEMKFGPARDNYSDWRQKRAAGMDRVNPRFVLRQWVLEETISELEDQGVDGIQQGRKVLSKILDMSTRPFYPWGQGEGEQDGQDARLCGLGKREMLGFQCSCSS